MNEPAVEASGKAIGSLVLGIIAMIAWLCPLIGLPIAIVGLILGILSLKTPKRGLAIAGIVLSGIGLLLTLANAGLGVYMALNNAGQTP